MEDVLDLYAEPYDPDRPVVCFDETSTQLLAEVREPLPPQPGRPRRQDYEYRRAGTRNIFLTCEPLAGWRHVAITERRTMADFAHQMQWLVDTAYPDAPVIRVVLETIGGLYRKVFTDSAPAFFINGKRSSSSRETTFSTRGEGQVQPLIAALSSDVFWWWYTATSNLRDLNPADVNGFPVPQSIFSDAQLSALGTRYLDSLKANSSMMVRNQKQTGKTETQSFVIKESKPVIDDIDHALAEHYGFTDEELDFIINYDIKYRMGRS